MIEFDETSTVFSAFASAAQKFGERPFLRAPAVATEAYANGAVEYTYASASHAVDRLRVAYQACDLETGDRVAVAFDSRLDVYLHLLALNALGVSTVPLNMGGSDQEIMYVLEHSDSRLAVGAAEHADRLSRLCGQLSDIEFTVIATQGNTESLQAPVGDSQTETALLYTSGTTGKPKGCMLSNYYFLNMGFEYNQFGGLCAIDFNDRLLTPLPPNHMNALATSFMAMLLCGGCVIQLDRFHPSTWWQTVRDEAATVIHYLGVMPAILLTLAKQTTDDFAGHVKFGFGAGSDPRHQELFEQRFGFPLVEGWAMTETGGAGMTVASAEPRHLGQRCIGKPVNNMEFLIANGVGEAVPCGVEGELLVRSKGSNPRKGFFSGYYKDAEATETSWEGGWWHTGDVVRQGDDGCLFFVDRIKNVIRRSGENIAAVEVEASLLHSDSVLNCAVTAVPDEIRGDEVFAFIVPSEGQVVGVELATEIFNSTRQGLSYFKLPAYIEFVSELPLTASQKVSRAEVKRLARISVESGEGFDLRKMKKRPRS